jgi:hypothetical protein
MSAPALGAGGLTAAQQILFQQKLKVQEEHRQRSILYSHYPSREVQPRSQEVTGGSADESYLLSALPVRSL